MQKLRSPSFTRVRPSGRLSAPWVGAIDERTDDDAATAWWSDGLAPAPLYLAGGRVGFDAGGREDPGPEPCDPRGDSAHEDGGSGKPACVGFCERDPFCR